MLATLSQDRSLNSVWEDLTFTEARLLGEVNAKELAPTFTELRKRLESVRNGQNDVWRDEVFAQAAVNAADDALDDCVHDLDVALKHVLSGDTNVPKYRRYFPVAPSLVIRMGLETELGRVRTWTDSLSSENEDELKALGARLGTLIAQGDAALAGRRKAGAARSDHRVRSIASLVDDINNARLSLYGTLARKAAELHLPRNWPDRFFQHGSRATKPEAQPTPVVVPTAG